MQNTLKFWISLNFQWGQLLPLPHLKSAPNYDYKKKKRKKKEKKSHVILIIIKLLVLHKRAKFMQQKLKHFAWQRTDETVSFYIYIYMIIQTKNHLWLMITDVG